ncbi:NAD-P-binding protein [Favolaschia claudopus]|uniref:NAD-P-binding protein n=1 Tax=Favolaschia claudopus TaxID=2862362 RepID=A0AAW0CR63_9AGAR
MSRGTVLITGLTGFIATHTALAFLNAGYSVKGTTRTAAKAEQWISRFPDHKPRFQYAVVPDMSIPGAFDEAVKGCDYIAHLASPAHWDQTDNEADLLIPAIEGTKNLLSATKNEPKIKRVVFTSSLAAIIEPTTLEPGKAIVETEWNPITYEEAKSHTNPPVVYRASKALAERAFWDFIQTEKPTWSGTSICPCATFGPPLQVTSLSALNFSNKFLWDIANGQYKLGVPKVGSPVFVDVREVALAHVRAVELDVAQGQRYLLIGGPYIPDQVVQIIHKEFPELRNNLPPVDSSRTDHLNVRFDSSKATKQLGIQYTALETMVTETITAILGVLRNNAETE